MYKYITKAYATENGLLMAEFGGQLRSKEAAHRKPKAGADDSPKLHIHGAAGEYMACLAKGVSWQGPGTFRGEDIKGHDVRTVFKPNGPLRLRKGDNPDLKYILVAPTSNRLIWNVYDWIYGWQGMQDIFWVKKPTNGRLSLWEVDQGALPILIKQRRLMENEKEEEWQDQNQGEKEVQ